MNIIEAAEILKNHKSRPIIVKQFKDCIERVSFLETMIKKYSEELNQMIKEKAWSNLLISKLPVDSQVKEAKQVIEEYENIQKEIKKLRKAKEKLKNKRKKN